MTKPHLDFFVIGAARAGTSSLHRLLARHDEVFVPTIKEPRFFTPNWDKGLDWYANFYAEAPAHTKRGDFSPNYANATGEVSYVARRIHRAYPHAKIIHMVRDPITCAISNWRLMAEVQDSPLSFGAALTHPDWAMAVYDRVCFHRQIGHYRAVFAEDQILAIPLERMLAEPGIWIDRLCRHIDVDPAPFLVPEQPVIGPRSLILNLYHRLRPRAPQANFPHVSPSDEKPARPAPPHITVADRQMFLDMVADDARAMLDYLKEPADLWDLSVTSPAWDPK